MKTDAFEEADPAQYAWQTGHFAVAPSERRLLEPLFEGSPKRALEIGCGQGANLFHLLGERRPWTVGVDTSLKRLKFARGRVPQAHFVCADAGRLPLKPSFFDLVFSRDLLHHVADPSKVLEQASALVAKPGRLVVIEPNGRNPVMGLWALVAGFERGLLRNSPRRLQKLFALCGLPRPAQAFSQPLPLHRVLFHYRFGLGGRARRAYSFVRAVERGMGRLVPRPMRAYLTYVFRF